MDGNAQNMFHGNHQGDAYFRYDATAPPRPMGPPGAYARHRAPHPLQQQQQQSQYPAYQPPADNMYTMAAAEQHGAAMGMGDLGAWSQQTPSPYGAPAMGYGHPQAPQQQQRQPPQPQPSYRHQHMTGYPQQDPQKMQFTAQQNLMSGMMPGQVYGQTQPGQPQRGVPQHYGQSPIAGHGMYPGAPQPQPTVSQPYGAGPYGAGLQQQQLQPGRTPHMGYGHNPMEQQAGYGQHLQNATPVHHMASAQQQQAAPQQMPGLHPGQPQPQQTSNHLPGHLPGQQPQQSLHQPQIVHPQPHSQPHTPHSISSLSSMHTTSASGQSQQQQQQQQQQQPNQHLPSQPQQQQQHPGLGGHGQQPSLHQPQHSNAQVMPPHNAAAYSHLSAYGVPPQSQQQQQQPSQPPQQQQQSQAQQQPSGPSPYLQSSKQQQQLNSGSPQYRAPFPQLSPQMSSPRPPQISPHPQMSPRPVMSPAKPQNTSSLSPHPHIPGVPSPRPGQQQGMGGSGSSAKNNSPAGPVTTLQALEQMVMPPQGGSMPIPTPMDQFPSAYRHQQLSANNPLSPMGPRMPMSPQQQPQQQQQWPPPPTQHRTSSSQSMPPHLYPQQQQQALGHQQQQQQLSPVVSQPQNQMTNQQHQLLSPEMGMGGQTLPSMNSGLSPFSNQQAQLAQSNMSLNQQQQQQQPSLQSHSIDEITGNIGQQHHRGLQLGSQMQHQQQQQSHKTPLMSHQQSADHLLMDPFGNGCLDTLPSMEAVSAAPVPVNDSIMMSGGGGSASKDSMHDNSQSMPAAPNNDENTQESVANSAMNELGQNSQDAQQHAMLMDNNLMDTSAQDIGQPQDNSSLLGNDHDSNSKHSLENNNSCSGVSNSVNQESSSHLLTEGMDQSNSGNDCGQTVNVINSSNNNSSVEVSTEVVTSQNQPGYDSQSDNSQSSLQPMNPVSETGSTTVQQASPITAGSELGQTEISSTDQMKSQFTDLNSTAMDTSLNQQQMPRLDQSQMMTPIPPTGQMIPMTVPPQMHGMPPQMMPPLGTSQDMYGMPGGLMHHQEKGMIQQQLQELYCMVPSPETTEKIQKLQERMNVLQQHEMNEQCNGGPQCSLQMHMYPQPMIESPQVSSTTGRGRGRGVSKPRKPRQKKADKLAALNNSESSPMDANNLYSAQSLPVSEDCVTPGAGLTDIPSEMTGMNDSDVDASQDKILDELDTSTDDKGKKKKKKAKESKASKEGKEKKKREPKEGSKSKKKKGKKGDEAELDSTIDTSMDPTSESKLELSSEIPPEGEEEESKDVKPATDEVTDFDDIPVSKIPIKSLMEDAAAKEEANENSDGSKPPDSETPKKKSKSKSSSAKRSRPPAQRKPPSSKSKRRGRMITESDGEGDDLISTPPPSPTIEGDIDSSKRRSARNTQRKKYVDDVMLRFSDDESGITSPGGSSKKEKKEQKEHNESDSLITGDVSTTDVVETKDSDKPAEDFGGKPNYVYVNTTDEDSMVVQYVLAMRMGKRELKPDPIPEGKVEPKVEETSEVKEETPEDGAEKTNEEKTEKPAEEDSTEKVEEKPKEISDAPPKEEEPKIESSTEEKIEEEEPVEKVDEPKEPESEKSEDSEMPVDEEPKTEATPETKEETKEGDEKPVVESDIKTEPVTEEKPDEPKPEPVYVDVEEYFVKYRNFSYLHCEWRTEEELFKGDRRVAAKIKRYHQKQAQQFNIFENMEEEPFNPDFTEVDRVLDMSEHKDSVTGEKTKHFLVKWKSLPYEDCTWELEEDVDHAKIEQFERFTKIPPRSEWKPKKRPHPDQWKKLEKTPVFKGGNTLRPYQLEGLNWLKFSWYNSHNCILADEMGLGKTIQSLTFVHSIYEYGIRGPFLVIAPLSTIPNWQREFESWTDMNVIVYHGSVTSKQMLQEYEFYYKNDQGKFIKDLNKFNVLITTFEMIVTDYMDLRQLNWRACVIDEAHRLKNRNCKLLDGLRQLNLEHRLLLSGTPLQNNVSELFSLLNFLEPSQFASNDDFVKEFGSLKTESEVQKLQVLLKPMMLRRLKDDVEKSLAPKEETIVEVELTNIQKKYYRGILEQNFSFLTKGTSAANIPNLMNTMMELRKCCIHPYLLNGAEEQIQYDFKLQHGEDPDSYYKNLINSSGKMVLIDKLLPKLKANGHRVLIFSQMVRCLDILEDYLVYRKYPFERIDGRIRGDLRQAAIDRYSKPDSDRFVFLLCTKAGGLGINLTSADTVIIYDSDWNPQNDLQAQARCHRIGQQKMVKIYRLLCRNTYEREMFDKASMKLGLDKAILQSMNTSQGNDTKSKQLSKKEIEDLLKKGAYGALMDEDEGKKFCEEDIDSILKRRTTVITMESEKGSTFSKASFAMSGNRADIQIDDPDFWKKWAKKADIDPAAERDEKEDLVILEPRRRTQIKRFGHDEGVMDISEESASDSDEEGGGVGSRMKRRRERREKRRRLDDRNETDYIPRERDGMGPVSIDEVSYGNWARSECFKVEKGLLSFGWGRWVEILEHGGFKRGWRDVDVEELARIILLYCLKCYRGDEKIKNFIWDLIAPNTDSEDTFRNHSGLHNLVPRGRNAKGRNGGKAQKDQQCGSAATSTASSPREKSQGKESDPNHWSNDDKYDADSILESSYRKHLARHANKVLLRVRMLFYIKHEIIGDYVQQISDGVNIRKIDDPMVLSYLNKTLLRDLPIRPPLTNEQMPSAWWNPNCCDKSLLVGTYKHGCENYREIRADTTLCFITHCGPPEDGPTIPNANMDEEGKLDDEDVDEDGRGTPACGKDDPKPSTSSENKDLDLDRPSSSGIDDDDVIMTSVIPPTGAGDDHTWPTMQDLNTRLRRVITSYQRNYKKEELKAAQQQKAKLQAMTQSTPLVIPSGSSSASSTPTPMGSGNTSSTPTNTGSANLQQQQQMQAMQKQTTSQQQQQNAMAGIPSAADIGLILSLGLGLNPADQSQLANIDLNKLAMYLQKFGSREKIEQQVRERERARLLQVSKKWNRREENEFLRVLTGYGIDLQSHTTIPTPDWSRFKAMARLEKKTDETMSDYYKVFIAMCKRQAGVKLLEDEKGLENIIDDINEDHARLILDRLELLSKLREVAKSSKLDDRLRLCKNNYDTPDWWESGKHDRELIRAILKHGLYRTEVLVMNDPDLSFRDSCRKYEKNLEIYNQNTILKMEAELLKLEQTQMLMKGIKAEELTIKPTVEVKPVPKEKEPEAAVEEDLTITKTAPTEEKPVEEPDVEMKEDEVKDKIETAEEEQKEKPVETEEKVEDIEKTAAPKSPSVVEKEAEEIDETAAPKTVEEESKDIKAEEPPTEEKMEIDEEEKKLPEVSAEEEKVTKEGEPEISEEPIEDESKAKVTPEEKEEEPENLEKIEKEVKEENTEASKEEVSEEVAERAKSVEKEKPQVEVIPIEKPASPKPVEKIPDVVLPKMDLLAELKIVEEECKKQAAELKARFPDLEVIQPSMKTKPLDPFLLKELAGTKDIKFIPKLLEKQLLIRWFRDFALEKRISHIIYCVEKNDWPVGKSYSAYTGCQGMDLDVPLYETIKRIPTATVEINLAGSSAMGSMGGRSQTPDVITITTDQGLTKQLGNSILASIQGALAGSGPTSQQQLNQSLAALSGNGKGKRKRHIAIDVETERAKLHALLNNSQSNQSGSKSWNEDELKGDLRRGSGGSSLQPPPAHQPMSRSSMTSYNKPTLIPGTSSTLTPIDLSSSLPKMNMASMMKNPIDLSEVQDFSMSSKSNKQSSGQSMSGSSGMGGNSPYSLAALGGGNNKGNKLDSMLSKLMKKNNVPVPVEEPVVGKEKKKRKLDEIVLGLSAAKEQKMYPDPMIPVGRKPQITPSVSVTPANVGGSGSSGTSSANQKPFTITVTSVPANSNSNKQQQQQKGGNNPSTTSGLQALQNMAGLSGASSKDLNALLAEAAKAEQQAFLKQQQKILQQLPANSPHRKTYEAMYNEMKQAADLSQLYNQKMGGFHSHDAKVNKWLQEQQTAMEQGAAELKRQTQRATRQNQQQQQLQQKQEAVFSRLSLTGEESVPVIHKITGKRLSGSKAPQLKRITQWLTENPAYEIDPKWLELAQIPPPSSPKPSPSAESTSSTSSSKPQHRSSSNSSAMANQNLGQYNASSSGSSASATKKQRAQDAALNAAMQFPGLAGLNPNLLANLPGLGANFDPKNPLSMLPFAGMAPGLAGLGNLGNLNNMNLFANLAGLGGLGNLAGMDPQSLAAMMTAAGLDANALAALTGASGSGTSGSSNQRGSSSGNSGAGSNSAASSSMKNQSSNQSSNTSKGRKEQTAATQQQSSSSSSNSKNNSGNNNSNFPFLFPNPSLLYPLGLNPYSLNPNMSPYDQLAQYSLLNGTNLGGSGSGSAGGSTQSPRQSGSGNKGNTGRQSGSGSGMSMSQSQQGSASKSGSRQSNSNSMGRQSDLSQLQSLLSPHDPHLLESLSRVAAGLDITQSNQRGSGGGSNDRKGRDSSSSSASSSMSASKDAMDKLEKERRKLMDNLARSGFPTDMATIQALAQGKLPPSLAKASTKDLQALAQLPPEFSQALLYEMAQAAGMGLPGMPGTSSSQGGSSNSASSASKRSSREAEMRELEAMSKAQMEILARNLGMSSSISLIPTSGQSMDALADKAKRRNESASLQRQSSQSQSQKHHEEAFALAMEEAKLRSIRESSSRSDRTSVSMSAETSIEKVPSSNSGSSQNPAMNLSSLPSQTTITLSSTSNSGAQSTSSQSSKRSVTPTDLSVPQAAENLSKPASSLEQSLPPKEVEQQSSHHEMDIEDLIAPSKVSKGGGMVMDEMEPEMDDQECQKSKKDDDELSNLDNSGGSSGGENDKNRPAKRARGKRPRSGDDLESLGVAQPERKRELRSSAGRAAAAAAARMAAEEKAAQAAAAAAAAQEGLNLSGGEDQKSESRT